MPMLVSCIAATKAERITEALKELAELGWVSSAPARDGSPGRRRDDWAVNPAVRAAAAATPSAL